MENVEKIQKTGLFTNYIYKAIPLAFDESMSYYETLCGLLSYLKDTVIPAVNNNADALIELQGLMQQLQDYVDNYFDNLDVQEEINNKLDEMVSTGELQELLNHLYDELREETNQEINTIRQETSSELSVMNSRINGIASGSPAGVYNTVTDLTNADPNHSKIYVVLNDGKWYYYDTSNSAWAPGGTYQSTSLGENVSMLNIDGNFKNQIKASVPYYTTTDGKVITTGLNVNDNDAFGYTSPIHLNYKDTIRFYGKGITTGTSMITLCDSAGNLIRSVTPSTGNDPTYYSFTAYTECYVILCSRNTPKFDKLIITNNIFSSNQFDDLFDEKISFIDNLLIAKRDTFNDYEEDKYVHSGTGNVYQYAETANKKYYASNFINIYNSSKIKLKSGYFINISSSDTVGICLYDSSKSFISGYQYANNIKEIEINVPSNAKYLRFTITKQMMQNNYWLYYEKLSQIITSQIANMQNIVTDNYLDLYKSFDKVGIIGDSLASGESAYKDTGVTRYVDLYQFSWGQYMARSSGNTYYNFSRGGLNTRTWLTNEKGLALATDGDHDVASYIMALGENDKVIEDYLGTISDIDLSDYTQNEDTFYGNYGKIIQILTARNPKVKFFLLTMPTTGTATTQYNTAIRNIANLFSNCYLVDLASSEYITQFTQGFIYNNKRAGHFNATAYNDIAQIISKAISKVMYDNYTDFKQVEFIMTDYEWSD